MKQILLINPPFLYFPNVRANLNYNRPPLGIAYIAAYIRKYFPEKLNIKIIDGLVTNLKKEDILKEIKDFKPQIVGISTVTATANFTKELAKDIKTNFKDIFVVAGGPHITALPFDLLPEVDICVVREGEETFLDILSCLDSRFKLEEIKGIAFMNNSTPVLTSRRKLINDLDKIPFPARDLLPNDKYFHIYPYSRGKFTTLFTSRGCPYNCYFCGNNILWERKVRFRSIENVIEEIEEVINKFNVSLIFFDDDEFSSNTERLRTLCGEITKRKLIFKWICHSTTNNLDLEVLKIMKKAGCTEIQVGIESGNQDTLNYVNKKTNLLKIKDKFHLIKKVGINTWATFIIGNPGETEDTIMQTIKFATEIDPTYASFIVLLPFPWTKIYEDFKTKGYIKTYDWNKYCWHNEPIFETDTLSAKKILELRKIANIRFYLRPKKILLYLKQSFLSRTFKEMIRNFIIFLSISFPVKQKIR